MGGFCKPSCSNDSECSLFCDPVLNHCVECLGDDDCGGQPCDKETGSCVGCLSDEDCPAYKEGPVLCSGNKPCGGKWIQKRCNQEKKECETACKTDKECPGTMVCHPVRETCVFCYKDQNCVDQGKGAFCDPSSDLGYCDECVVDADCGSEAASCEYGSCYFFCSKDEHCTDPTHPHCNQATGQCGECGTSNDCKSPEKPFCQDEFQCVSCLSNSDCPWGETCLGVGSCSPLCKSDADCLNPVRPYCVLDLCVECLGDGDCKDPASPRCDTDLNTCVACLTDFDCPPDQQCKANNACSSTPTLCKGDPGDDGDDVRAQAKDVTPFEASSSSSASGAVCNVLPQFEKNWCSFQSQQGESWTLALLTGTPISPLPRLEVFGEDGTLFGQSFFQNPQTIQLSYLPAGKYWIRVRNSPYNQSKVFYSLQVERTVSSCSLDEQCGGSSFTEVYRSLCLQGACVWRNAGGTRSQGELCDHSSDCSSGLVCTAESAIYASAPGTRSFCTPPCKLDVDCPDGQRCGGSWASPRCELPCTEDAHCGAFPPDPVVTPGQPWRYGLCQDGRCH